MRSSVNLSINLLAVVLAWLLSSPTSADEPTYARVQAVLTKYCAGCHNADEANGEFSVHTFAGLIKGGEHGNAITPGSSNSSKMIQLMKGRLEPKMPPDDEPAPSDDDIQLIADWIDAGAKGPTGKSSQPSLKTPKIESLVSFEPITAIAVSQTGDSIAVGKFKSIEIRDAAGNQTLKTIDGLPGKVTSVAFLRNDQYLIAGTGIGGLFGEAILIRLSDGEIERRFRGHNDMVYSVALSDDEKLIATSGYDRKSVLWKIDSDQPLRTFTGHNDAVFENVFGPGAETLVTASADGTIKIWRVNDAQRLDTRGEPLKEQYTVAISPEGQWIVAGGEDNRIRKWELISKTPNQTNPLAISRFAHESAIQLLRFHEDGQHLVSVGNDGTIKIWDTKTLTQRYRFASKTSDVQAIAVTKDRIITGSLDGSVVILDWPKDQLAGVHETTQTTVAQPKNAKAFSTNEFTELAEVEPNDSASEAMAVEVPFEINGTIDAENQADVDTFRFVAKQGQRWIVEVRASRDKSPLDSHVAVLDAKGHKVPRVLLRAVRDSYFTFRGKDSRQTGDFRIHNWEEMQLNQLLYCNGEVVKLYHYPRGPDSGFNVYPNFGNRHGMFDTTAIAHALHEPCYIVEAYPPGTELPANGLPQFLLNYENDDDAERELGTDSRLTFDAPSDGEYLVRVRDTRDSGGAEFKYRLTVRPESPSFELQNIAGQNPTLTRGVYKRFEVTIDRKDNFSGPVTIEIGDLPRGITANDPITVEPNGLRSVFYFVCQRKRPPTCGG